MLWEAEDSGSFKRQASKLEQAGIVVASRYSTCRYR